jgi:hypothetical protein
MLDVKSWLESTSMQVAENCFLKPPSLPYIVFILDEDVGGADNKNCISNRGVNIEFYSSRIDRASEQKIENLLNEKSIEYKKNRTWIKTETFFQTVYEFQLLEKF